MSNRSRSWGATIPAVRAEGDFVAVVHRRSQACGHHRRSEVEMSRIALAVLGLSGVAAGLLCVAAPATPARAANPDPEGAVSLFTVPRTVYKLPDLVDAKEKQDCFYFHLVVRDIAGRALDPRGATLRLYGGSTELKT